MRSMANYGGSGGKKSKVTKIRTGPGESRGSTFMDVRLPKQKPYQALITKNEIRKYSEPSAGRSRMETTSRATGKKTVKDTVTLRRSGVSMTMKSKPAKKGR